MLKLVREDDPILREVMPKFDFAKDNAVELYEQMKEAIVQFGGLGLSAPQIGLRHRMFIVGNVKDPNTLQAVFNPLLLMTSKEAELDVEGCLSFPGLFLKIKRPKEIRVRFSDHTGNTDTFTLHGVSARVFCHELDHLDGMLFIKRASYYHLQQGQKKRRKPIAKDTVHVI